MKRCSTSIITREIQIKTAVKYHPTLIRTAIIEKSTGETFLVVQWFGI